jgi:hypothetical protein
MSPATRREQRAWERKATSRRMARRAEVAAYLKAFASLLAGSVVLALLVVAGLWTTRL